MILIYHYLEKGYVDQRMEYDVQGDRVQLGFCGCTSFSSLKMKLHQNVLALYTRQALQFLLGAHLPEGKVHNMTEDMRREIWVLGILHAPADHVRQCRGRNVGCYLFHSELHEGNARTALLGNYPELVRIENGLKWHNAHAISIQVPRVVHPDDVLIRRVHVAGQKKHYVCGVSAVEDIVTNTYTNAVASYGVLHVPRRTSWYRNKFGLHYVGRCRRNIYKN
jgi:hypothetical protein